MSFGDTFFLLTFFYLGLSTLVFCSPSRRTRWPQRAAGGIEGAQLVAIHLFLGFERNNSGNCSSFLISRKQDTHTSVELTDFAIISCNKFECIFLFLYWSSAMSLDALFRRAGHDRLASLTDAATISYLRDVLEVEDVTFIIGSAVSLFPSSSVVNGQRVTEAIAGQLAEGLPGEEVVRSFIAKAAFEVVLQYNDCDAEARDWLLKLFSSESPRRPNAVHRALATLLAHRPAHVITTNYDRFIERSLDGIAAFETILSEADAVKVGAEICYFKIHGCVSDPSSLVFKLDQERPLQGWKARTFRHWSKEERSF